MRHLRVFESIYHEAEHACSVGEVCILDARELDAVDCPDCLGVLGDKVYRRVRDLRVWELSGEKKFPTPDDPNDKAAKCR